MPLFVRTHVLHVQSTVVVSCWSYSCSQTGWTAADCSLFLWSWTTRLYVASRGGHNRHQVWRNFSFLVNLCICNSGCQWMFETIILSRSLNPFLVETSILCLHGTAPPYLADQLQPVAALESRRRLRSSASARLGIPRARRTTIGDRAFCVAGPRIWNSLSSSTQSAPSLFVFRRLLKCELFHRCYDLC